MFSRVAEMFDGDKMIPLVRLIHDRATTHLWEDEVGDIHKIAQGEGGDQGNPLMPLLFSVGQQRSLVAILQLKKDEHLFAFLDDIYVVSHPSRVKAICGIVEHQLRTHAGIYRVGVTSLQDQTS